MEQEQIKNNEGVFKFEGIISGLIVIGLLFQVLHLWGITLSKQILVGIAWFSLGLMLVFFGFEAGLPQKSSQYPKKYRWLSIGTISMLVLGISYLPEKFDWMDDLTFLLIMSVSVILFTVFWIGKIIPLEFFGNEEQDLQDWHLENASVKILYGSDLVAIVLIALNSWHGYLSFLGLKQWMSILVAFFMFQFLLRAVILISWVVDSKFQRDKLTPEDLIPFFTGTVITFFYPLEEVTYITGVFSLLLIWITILILRVNGSFESNKEKPELKLGVIILFLAIV